MNDKAVSRKLNRRVGRLDPSYSTQADRNRAPDRPGDGRELAERPIPGLAAEIAFFTVLALVPGLLAVVTALGSLEFLLGRQLARQAEERIVSFLSAVLTERADQTLRAAEEIFSRDNSGLISFATVAAVWAMSRSLMGTIRALDVAYDLPRQNSWVKTRIKALLLALGTVLILALLLAVVIVGPLLGLGRALAEFAGTPAQATELFLLIRYPLAFLLLMVWALMIYQFGPNHDWPWRWNAPARHWQRCYGCCFRSHSLSTSTSQARRTRCSACWAEC